MAGFVVGVGSGVIILLTQRPSAPSVRETPQYVRADFAIVDAVTGRPLEADITIRRERDDGALIEPEMFYNGQHIVLEVPADDYRTWLLVEKPGYQDWERELVPDILSMLSGPIRLAPVSGPMLPYPQS